MSTHAGENAWSRDVAVDFKAALRGVASTVAVVTSIDAERHHGMTATAFMSLSMEPPSVVVAINQATLLHDVLMSARRFCVNVLNDTQELVSTAFSDPSTAGNRFLQGAWSYDDNGLGFLADAQASIFCTKAAVLPFGTHSLFIGMVEDVRSAGTTSPLLYHNTAYCTPLPRRATA